MFKAYLGYKGGTQNCGPVGCHLSSMSEALGFIPSRRWALTIYTRKNISAVIHRYVCLAVSCRSSCSTRQPLRIILAILRTLLDGDPYKIIHPHLIRELCGRSGSSLWTEGPSKTAMWQESCRILWVRRAMGVRGQRCHLTGSGGFLFLESLSTWSAHIHVLSHIQTHTHTFSLTHTLSLIHDIFLKKKTE